MELNYLLNVIIAVHSKGFVEGLSISHQYDYITTKVNPSHSVTAFMFIYNGWPRMTAV